MRCLIRYLATLLFCLITINYTIAQIKTSGFSIKAGYSLSAQSQDMFAPVSYYRYDVDFFYIGFDYEQRFKYIKNSTIIYGIDFTKKGYRADVIYNYDNTAHPTAHFKWHYDLYYAELPIVIRTYIENLFNVSYGIAPAFSFYNYYYFYHSYSSSIQHSESSISKTFDYNYFRGYDIQLCIGISKDITNNLSIEINGRRGFLNQNKKFMGEIGIQNLLMIGLRYNFAKPKNHKYEINSSQTP